MDFFGFKVPSDRRRCYKKWAIQPVTTTTTAVVVVVYDSFYCSTVSSGSFALGLTTVVVAFVLIAHVYACWGGMSGSCEELGINKALLHLQGIAQG